MLTTKDRAEEWGPDIEIEGYLGFDFEARGDRYSSQKYHWYHFSAVDWDEQTKEQGQLYKIRGENKHFAEDVSREKGGYGMSVIISPGCFMITHY